LAYLVTDGVLGIALVPAGESDQGALIWHL
jgi:hypothetical protein